MKSRVIVGLLASLLVACGGSSATDAGSPLVGVYQLTLMHDNSLPARLSLNGEDVTYLVSDVLTVNAGGTYQTQGRTYLQLKIGPGSFSPVSSTGTYSASGGGYTFTGGELDSGTGTLSASAADSTQLTVSLNGVTYVFVKNAAASN